MTDWVPEINWKMASWRSLFLIICQIFRIFEDFSKLCSSTIGVLDYGKSSNMPKFGKKWRKALRSKAAHYVLNTALPKTRNPDFGYPISVPSLNTYSVYANMTVLNVAKEIHTNGALPFGLFYNQFFFS